MKALNRFVVLFAVVAASSFATRAQAADDTYTWDVTGGSNATYTHTNTQGNGSHTFGIGAGVSYFMTQMIELGGTVNFNTQSASSTKQFQLLVGPTFNFMGTPENAIFVTGQAGVKMFGNGPSAFAPNATTFSYLVGVGKRIEIVKHVTWSPEVAFTGNTKAQDSTTGFLTPSSNGFEVIPFQFTLLF